MAPIKAAIAVEKIKLRFFCIIEPHEVKLEEIATSMEDNNLY
jgi:hypothetical protein